MNASTAGTTDAACGPVPRRRSPWKVRRWTVLAALAAPVVLAGCNFYPSYGASRGATTQGNDTFKLYSGMMTAGIIVGGFVAVLILWAIFRYRRPKGSDHMPVQFHENLTVEILYTAIPIVIVLVIFFFTVITENRVTATVPAKATVTADGRPIVDVTVTAFQWGWRFSYPNLNVSVYGETTNGPDNHGPQMVLPEGATTQVTLVSDDVIHGFYVRDFNFSRYAQPGVTNIFDLTVNQLGTFDGQCTQFCGLYHADMLFSVRSVTQAQFRAWAASEVLAGNTLNNPASRPGAGAQNIPPADTHITPSSAPAPLPPGSIAKAAA